MKEFLKKRLALVLALFMVITVIPWNIQTWADETQNQSQVEIGDNAVATYDADTQTIYVNGTGELGSYQGGSAIIAFPSAKRLVVKDGITGIGYGCFGTYNTNIEYVELANSVKKIGGWAFENFAGLKKVTAPGVTDVGAQAFLDCYKLVDTQGFVIINGILVDFYRDNKDNGGKPYSVVIPEGVTRIGEMAFMEQWGGDIDDMNLISAVDRVTLSSTVRYIDQAAFQFAYSLEDIDVPDNNEYFKSQDGVLFSKDGKRLLLYPNAKEAGLTYNVPDGVEEIDDSAFPGGETIETIVLPSSLKSLGDKNFVLHVLGNLKKIEVSSENKYFKSQDGVLFTKDGKTLVQYPIKKADKSYTIGSGVTTVAYEAFRSCTELNTLEIGENVNTIGTGALGVYKDQDSFTVKFKGNAPKIINEFDGEYEPWIFETGKVDVYYPNYKSGWDDSIVGHSLGAYKINWIAYGNDGNKNVNGLAQASDGNWYYFKNGKVDTSFNSLAQVNGKGTWWYVKNGKVDFSATTLCQYNGTWWYVHNGRVDFSSRTLVNYNGIWWFVENGKVNWNATTVVKYGSTWYYVSGGQVRWNATTLCQYNGTWWYVEKGKINFSAKTLVNYNKTWWFVENGKVNWNATTVVKYGSTWYYVSGGQVRWNATTLCKYNGTWWYIHNGVIDFKSTTLVKYGSTWYAVSNGQVAWNYTGYIKYYGKSYRVVKGVVKF